MGLGPGDADLLHRVDSHPRHVFTLLWDLMRRRKTNVGISLLGPPESHCAQCQLNMYCCWMQGFGILGRVVIWEIKSTKTMSVHIDNEHIGLRLFYNFHFILMSYLVHSPRITLWWLIIHFHLFCKPSWGVHYIYWGPCHLETSTFWIISKTFLFLKSSPIFHKAIHFNLPHCECKKKSKIHFSSNNKILLFLFYNILMVKVF